MDVYTDQERPVTDQGGFVLKELGARLERFGWAVVLLVASLIGLVLFLLTVLSLLLVVVWIGIPMAVLWVTLIRQLARLHRFSTERILDYPIRSPYPRGGWQASLRHPVRAICDPSNWRDLTWLMANSTVGLFLLVLALLETLLGVFFWWLPRSFALYLHARLNLALLAPPPPSAETVGLTERVRTLTRSRAETVDTQAAELRRIERDLHDGAQARMVAVGMSLGLAEQVLERDPAYARQLLGEARSNNTAALEELRDLVRGIHPPVLADRGLVGAVEALVLATPLPVTITGHGAGAAGSDERADGRADERADARAATPRLPAAVESAAYFAVAEALTNVIRHSGATAATIELGVDGPRLRMRVSDDGVGGADPARGSGLRGIERRLSAFDGTVTTSSPDGGPTVITMELPCGLS